MRGQASGDDGFFDHSFDGGCDENGLVGKRLDIQPFRQARAESLDQLLFSLEQYPKSRPCRSFGPGAWWPGGRRNERCWSEG